MKGAVARMQDNLYHDMILPEETIDTDGEIGEMVTTDLSHIAMPVIRYRTGDLVEGFDFEPCPCGRTSPRIKQVVGWTGDIIRVKGIYLVPDRVKQVISTHDSLGKFQIVIDRLGHRKRLFIKVESSDSEKDQGIKQRLIEDLRVVTRLRAEIDLIPLGSIGQDTPMVIDERLY